MATNTTKLGLVKPDLKDVADITVINNNMDLIDQFATNTDAAINGVSSSLSEHAGQHAVGGSDPLTLSMLGVNATAEELNYVDGVTSNIQMQLDNKDELGAANTALNNAKAHTNEVAQTTLTDAKRYTDETASATLNDAKEYADGVSNTALSEAKQYTDDSITGLINGAPTTLDTLKEIADAMAENEDVVAALDQAIGNKADIGHTHTHEELEIESVVATDANNDGNVVLMGYASDEAEAHIGDKNNPHNVTIAQIGAAPAGYGLGENAVRVADLNANGYVATNATPNGLWYWGQQYNFNAQSAAQVLYGNNNSVLMRQKTNGAWGGFLDISPSAFAPSGYGLGEDCQTISSWDDIRKNGFYKSNNGSPDAYWWWGLAFSYSNGTSQMQHAFRNGETADYPMIHCVRNGEPGAFGEWEYVNPPMALGVEYRTTERWQGKAVYTMLVHCGAGAVAGGYKTVTTSIAGTANTIKYHVDITNSNGNKLGNPPTKYEDGSIMGRITVSSTNNITMMCYQDLSETDIYCQLWYTKD